MKPMSSSLFSVCKKAFFFFDQKRAGSVAYTSKHRKTNNQTVFSFAEFSHYSSLYFFHGAQ